MDKWFKYKKQIINYNIHKINISEAITYGNYLISKITFKIICNKKPKRLINKLFKISHIIIAATSAQKNDESFNDAYNYIDDITNKLQNTDNSAKDLALLLGNLSEYTDTHYTFIEKVAFVRCIANKI